MPSAFQVGDLSVARGEKAWGRLPLAAGPDGVDVSVPIAVVCGPRDGPVVYIGAGTHGEELNGIECARRLAVALDPRETHGTIIVVPIHNVLSFLGMRRETPWDGLNANRLFPGNPEGWFTERMVHTLYTTVMRRAEVIIDFHGASTGGRCLTHVYTPPATPDAARRSVELATVFGPDVIIPMVGTTYEGFDLRHSLHVVAGSEGTPTLCAEIGEGLRLEEPHVLMGMTGTRRVLDALGVYPDERARSGDSRPAPMVAREVVPVRCQSGGLVIVRAALGERVRAGQVVATVTAIPDRTEEVRAPVDGLVFRIHTRGICIPGDRMVLLATVA